MSLQDDVVKAANMMLELDADEESFVPRLVATGCKLFQTKLLIHLVPLAFGRSIIAGRAGMPSKMPEVVEFPTRERCYVVRLTAIPEFAAAFEVATNGVIPPDQVATVARWGSELRAIQDSVEAGHDLTRSQVSPPLMLGIADAPEFTEWFNSFGPNDRLMEQLDSPPKSEPPPKKPWWRFW